MSSREWVDYYEILGIKSDASAKEISSAYRSLALKHHPDKSTSTESLQRFHALSKAYQVLTDQEARRAFDAVLAGREARKQREVELDSSRREMRDELLRRERDARKRKADEEVAELELQREMERLRREAQAQAKMKDLETKEKDKSAKVPIFDDLDRTLKVAVKGDELLNESSLRLCLVPYGELESLVISKRQKNGVVQFTNVLMAKSVMMDSDRNLFNSIQFSWAKGQPPILESAPPKETKNPKDFESLTLMRMRQAAERKQLQAKLEEKESDG